jgi:hypothetical protein
MHKVHTDICLGNVEATETIHHLKMKVLEPSTAAEQEIHILLPDADAEELDLLQLREMKSRRGINLGE